jgi:hypothetical protein
VLLHDRRLAQLGGRDGLPRSLGSVLSCYVARFLGDANGFRGVACGRVTLTQGEGNAVHAPKFGDAHVLRAALGARPLYVCMALDGTMVAVHREEPGVRVFDANTSLVSCLNDDTQYTVVGLCASRDHVVIQETGQKFHFTVLCRQDGALVRGLVSNCGQRPNTKRVTTMCSPCFLPGGDELAVIEIRERRVVVLDLTGRRVLQIRNPMCSREVLPPDAVACPAQYPVAVACSAAGEFVVVTDTGDIFVFPPRAARAARPQLLFGQAAKRLSNLLTRGALLRATLHGSVLVAHETSASGEQLVFIS